MAENEKVKSKRDAALERLSAKHPEVNLEDEEALFGQINDDFDNYDNELSQYKEHEDAFAKMFSSDPRSAAFLTDWRNGEDPTVGLVRKFGMEIRDVLDDPEMQEKLAEANKEYLDRVAKNAELEEQYQKNLAESLSLIAKMQEEQGYSDEQIDQAMDWLIGINRDMVLGKFTPEVIAMAMKAQNYDSAVAQAEAEGEVRGRNTRIEEKLRGRSKGDGMAQLDGKVKSGGVPDMPDLGAIDRYNDGVQNIWERGGERRTRR